MDIIQIKITRDKNVISYIKLIKAFDKTVSANGISVSEIKKNCRKSSCI